MRRENLEHICTTKDDSLCGGWLLVANWRFPTSCCDVVSLGKMSPQVSTSTRLKGRILQLESGTYKIESIDQLNVHRIDWRTLGMFGQCYVCIASRFHKVCGF